MWTKIKKIILILISCVLLNSCIDSYYLLKIKIDNVFLAMHKKRDYKKYKKKEHMNFRENVYVFFNKGFIVDTVQFKNPIVVSYYRYYFICEDSVIKSSDDVIKAYLNPNVYSYDFDDTSILHFKELFKIYDRPSLPLVLDTSRKEKSEYVEFYKFKKEPDYFLLIICPMNRSMGLNGIRCYERAKTKSYRELYKRMRDFQKAKKPEIVNGAYMRHIICVWKKKKTDDDNKDIKD